MHIQINVLYLDCIVLFTKIQYKLEIKLISGNSKKSLIRRIVILIRI